MGTSCTESVWEVLSQTPWIHPSFAPESRSRASASQPAERVNSEEDRERHQSCGDEGECCRQPVPYAVGDVPAFSAGEGKNPVIKASENPNRCGNYGQVQSKPEQPNERPQPLEVPGA